MKKNDKNSIFNRLENVYREIPDTVGCMDNICQENGCRAWCCVLHFPHLLSSEFERTWTRINKKWSIDKIIDLIEKALRNYLVGEVTKGCIFWDKETKMCSIHSTRPYACYLYGITPKEEFNRRYKLMVERYKDNPLMFFKPQCNLIKTVDNKEVTEADTDKWWKSLLKIEEDFGVDPKDIRDNMTYLSHHDHLLAKILPQYLLENLSKVRVHGTQVEKDNIISVIIKVLKTQMEKNNGEEKDTSKEDKS